MIKKHMTTIKANEVEQRNCENITEANIDKVYNYIWQDYIKDITNDNEIKDNFEKRQVVFNDSVMKYEMFTVGEKPVNGYPLYITLHGGGSVPEEFNNSQWEHMKVYYRSSLEAGVYIAARGIADTWNVHFRDESYPLYDKLVETMIALADVDPNKVYFLGFSAGGDGVYQITPRLTDKIAAANMSAGHPNGVSLRNILNTPLLLQVGEVDTAFDRSKEVAKYCKILCDLQKEHGGYIHDAFIHIEKPHNFKDNDDTRTKQVVVANLQGWLENGDKSSKEINTNAVDWVSQYSRNPYPSNIIWDLDTKAELRDIKSFYWLRVDDIKSASGYIEARLDKENNSVIIDTAKTDNQLTILLNNKMLNIFKPVNLYIEGEKFEVTPEISEELIIETTYERGDKNYQFEAGINIKKVNNEWKVTSLKGFKY